jgi:hypothetical protein
MSAQTKTTSSTTAPIVDTLEDLTPSWFTAALREGGTIAEGHSVTSVSTELIGTGQVGLVVLAQLEYNDPSDDAPASVVVKLPSPDAGSRRMGAAMGLYDTEVHFYKEVAPRLGPAIPRMHWGEVDAEAGRFTLLLDDLTQSSEVGDMVAGCSLERAAIAIKQLSQLQAPVWADPDLPARPWLEPARTDMIFAAVAPSVDPFLDRFAERLEPEHLELVQRMAPHAASYRTRAWEPPYVVAHSDYRLDNMLFGTTPEAPPISVIDWQGARLAPPLLDATILLGACISTEQRRMHERDLLRAYHDGLLAEGVAGFSFDDCLESYRRCSPWAFLGAIPVSVTIVQTERGDAMWARMVRGCANLVLDTGADDLLD